MSEILGNKKINSQFLGNKPIIRTYKGDELINEYKPLYNPPLDWKDIRSDCPENSIALYAGVKSDYSQYDNLGFTATCVGGYNVFIDGVQYGSTYASNAQCNITWSSLALTTGDNITTPSALKAHKIWVEPATSGNNITAFHCARVASSGQEEQGILWEHFNITNAINISTLNAVGNYGSQDYKNTLLIACTAKNNLLKVSGDLYCSFFPCRELEYLPVIDGNNTKVDLGYFGFAECNKIKKIDIRNLTFEDGSYAFAGCTSLEKMPKGINYASAKYMSNYLTNAISLTDTVLDIRTGTGLKIIGCYGNASHFMSGFKGLRVSNEAPFDYSTTAPQINVSYTGMDRDALMQLFNDLPYNVGYEVVGNPTINNGVISGFSSSDYIVATTSINWLQVTEIVVKINIPSAALNQSRYMNAMYGGIQLFVYSATSNFQYCGFNANGMGDLFIQHGLEPDKDYWIKYTSDGTNSTALWSEDGLNYTAGQTKLTSTITSNPGIVRFGSNTGNRYFDGSIDLNNTYIKVNDVYWFRGQPAMTKTINVVGCTGTSSLTADDRAIVTDKGWSITYQ